jgi:hypothetical protein
MQGEKILGLGKIAGIFNPGRADICNAIPRDQL